MWAAKMAGRRGHEVELYEKSPQMGGQVLLAMKGAGREEFGVLSSATRARSAEARGRCGSASSHARDDPQRRPRRRDLRDRQRAGAQPVDRGQTVPGIYDVWQMLQGKAELGEKVCLVDTDGHHRATATAEFMAMQGKRVDISARGVRRRRARADAGPVPHPATAPPEGMHVRGGGARDLRRAWREVAEGRQHVLRTRWRSSGRTTRSSSR